MSTDRRFPWTLALTLAVLVGGADFSAGFLQEGVSAVQSAAYLTPALVGALTAVLAFLVLALPGSVLGRRLGLPALAVELGLWGWLACSFTLPLALELGEASIATLHWPRLMVLGLPVGLLTGVVGWGLARTAWQPATLRSLCLVLGLATGITVPVLWLLRFTVRHSAAGQLGLVGLAGLLVLGLAVLVLRHRERAPQEALLGLVLLGFPLGMVLGGEPGSEPTVAPSAGATPSVRRVILVVADTLRVDHLSCYGGQVPTPNLDRLAAQGLLFEQARSAAPWTLAAMASMFTGLAPEVHGCTQVGRPLPARVKVPTLAERFAAAGYRTAAIGTNPTLRPWARLDRGFEDYDWFPRLQETTPLGSSVLRWLGRDDTRQALADELSRLAVEWIDAHREEPFFLWLHYFDPHATYDPPGEHRPADVKESAERVASWTWGAPDPIQREKVRKLYGGEVTWLDEQLGELFARLAERGLWEDSLIVFVSDHGEEFWDHGGYEHGHTLYDELVHVPLIIKPPASAGARPARLSTPVSTRDLGRTLLELCAVEPVGDALRFPGAAFLRASSAGYEALETGPVFSSGILDNLPQTAVFEGTMKYVQHVDAAGERLHDLAVDPLEEHSLVAHQPPALEELRAQAQAFQSRAIAERIALDLDHRDLETVSPEVLKALRELGYVDGE